MTLLQLEYVMEIWKCGSINKAAQTLFVSQSGLSSAIRELEEEMGIQIFARNNRGVQLTDDGADFLSQIRPILEQQQKIKRFYTEKNDRDTLRFSVSSQRYPFCAEAFVRFLESAQAPRMELGFKETDMDRVIRDVAAGESEIGIIFLSDQTERFVHRVLEHHRLCFREIMELPSRVFLSKDHPLAQKESLRLEELTEYPYVVFARKKTDSIHFSEESVIFDRMPFAKMIYINDRASFYNIVAHSQGVSIGSGILPKGYYDERIKAVPLADEVPPMRIGWICSKERSLHEKTEEFIRQLKKVLQEESIS